MQLGCSPTAQQTPSPMHVRQLMSPWQRASSLQHDAARQLSHAATPDDGNWPHVPASFPASNPASTHFADVHVDDPLHARQASPPVPH